MLLGRAPKEKTLLLLDVENGSVGAALARLSSAEAPKLFGERRVHVPVGQRVTGAELAAKIEHAAEEVLREVSHVAAKLRGHEATAALGSPERAAVFLSPPWGRPNLAAGRPDFLPSMTSTLRKTLSSVLEGPTHFYTAAGAAAHAARLLGEAPSLICSVTGEISELMLIDDTVRAHATIPLGTHALVRTLRTHAGLSEHEARSALRLPFNTPRMREPFDAAAEHFAGHFSDAAREIISAAAPERLHVIARGGAGEWYARALSQSPAAAALFPRGGEVRPLRAQQISRLLSGHAADPDLVLALEALFVDSSRDTQVR